MVRDVKFQLRCACRSICHPYAPANRLRWLSPIEYCSRSGRDPMMLRSASALALCLALSGAAGAQLLNARIQAPICLRSATCQAGLLARAQRSAERTSAELQKCLADAAQD